MRSQENTKASAITSAVNAEETRSFLVQMTDGWISYLPEQ